LHLILVGVDAASVRDGRIAFTSSIARAFFGKRAGRRPPFVLGPARQELELLSVAY